MGEQTDFKTDLWVIRHGETEWSRSGRHTSTTDLPLTPKGEESAKSLRQVLEGQHFDLVVVDADRADLAVLHGKTPTKGKSSVFPVAGISAPSGLRQVPVCVPVYLACSTTCSPSANRTTSRLARGRELQSQAHRSTSP